MKEAKTLKDKDDRTQGKVSRPKDKKMSKTTFMVITKYSLTLWNLYSLWLTWVVGEGMSFLPTWTLSTTQYYPFRGVQGHVKSHWKKEESPSL
jgi:hypothetical protein